MLCLHVYHVVWLYGVHGDNKEDFDSLDPELQLVVSHHMGTSKEIHVLGNSKSVFDYWTISSPSSDCFHTYIRQLSYA